MSSKSQWSDLLPRVVSAVVLMTVSVVCILQGGWCFDALLLLVFGAAAYETAQLLMLHTSSFRLSLWMCVNLCVYASLITGHMRGAGLLLVLIMFFGLRLWVLSLILAFGCFSLFFLRAENIWDIIFAIAVVCASDSMAYFTGRIVGGAKLAPSISPGKTRSGACGGLLGAAGLGWLIAWYVQPSGSVYGLLWGGLLGIAAQLGDLAESAVKRRLAIKDTGTIIPGHGGVLDRFDGLLCALPVAFLATFCSPGKHLLWLAFTTPHVLWN